MKIAITGASGFIGNELVSRLAAKHSIIALRRRLSGSAMPNVEERKFDLEDEATFAAVKDADVLVHCAFIKAGKDKPNANKTNIETVEKLAGICRQNGVFFIFISTMSAHQNALSEYGKHKFEIENKLDANLVSVLKLGLVMGNTGGLFNTIKQTIAKASVVPLISGGKQPIQIIHIEDLTKIIEKVSVEKLSGVFSIGTPKVYTMKYMYEQIAHAQNKQIRFVSLPFVFMKLGLGIVEGIGLTLPVTTENLLGLKQLQAFDTAPSLNKIGVELMELEQAIKNL